MECERTYVYLNTIRKGMDGDATAIFGGPGELAIGPAPEFGGRAGSLNPEELFVAAINGCLLMTLSYFLQRSKIEIESYEADAEGQVKKDKDGLRFVEVTVRATATVKDPSVAEKICDLAGLAEKHCLVSRSVSCPVHYHLSVEISEE
jgi:organic hydroperoxide reductase OsmC/OhrA